ncbi:hypothetical protein BJV74DRAFT_784066, partial [Russula compacta]
HQTAEWHAFAKLQLHTESTLQHLGGLMTELGKPKNLNLFTYKWHALGDYVQAIHLFGGTDGFSTQVGKLAHKFVKHLYGMTNKCNAEPQIAKFECTKLALDRKQLHNCKKWKAAEQGDAHGEGDSDLWYHISASKKNPQDIFSTICNNKGDPTYYKSLPKLQDHLLGQLMGCEFDSDMHKEFMDLDHNSIHFIGNKIYSIQTCCIYYTSYNLQWQCDTVSLCMHPDIMLRSPVTKEGAEPYWYARVIGIYHANIWAKNPEIPGGRNARCMDFLWVHWFGDEPGYHSSCRRAHLPEISFLESTDNMAFSFVDPANVIHRCHLIPAFNAGWSADPLPHPHSIAHRLNPEDVDDWLNFYVNM